MARACVGALKPLLQRSSAITGRSGCSDPPALRFSCLWVRHLFRDKRRNKYVDPFRVPTLYTGVTKLEAKDPVIKPRPPPRPRRNLNRQWRGLQKTRYVNADRKKFIEFYRARTARREVLRVKRWRENAARLKVWKAEAREVYATKKITAIRGLPELLLEKHERTPRGQKKAIDNSPVQS